MLQGNGKVFGAIGIALAMYSTTPKENIHALLAATMDTIMYGFGVVGNMGGGLLDFIATNWIPLGQNHWMTYVAQVIIGLIFSAIYFFVFRCLILKFDIPLPGRRAEEEVKLFSKKIIKRKGEDSTDTSGFEPSNEYEEKAYYYLEGLGGKENIKDVTNCTTRLRLTVNDKSRRYCIFYTSTNVTWTCKSGKNVQVVVGMTVPQVREAFEHLVFDENDKNKIKRVETFCFDPLTTLRNTCIM